MACCIKTAIPQKLNCVCVHRFFDIPMEILPEIRSSAEVYGAIVSYSVC